MPRNGCLCWPFSSIKTALRFQGWAPKESGGVPLQAQQKQLKFIRICRTWIALVVLEGCSPFGSPVFLAGWDDAHAFWIPVVSFANILLLVVSVCLPKRSKHGTRAALKDLNIGPKVVEESFRQDLSKICPKTLRVFTPPLLPYAAITQVACLSHSRARSKC